MKRALEEASQQRVSEHRRAVQTLITGRNGSGMHSDSTRCLACTARAALNGAAQEPSQQLLFQDRRHRDRPPEPVTVPIRLEEWTMGLTSAYWTATGKHRALWRFGAISVNDSRSSHALAKRREMQRVGGKAHSSV
ncbi:hypothetical protein AAFF_G00055480 [Aldrovandia affinis]|uniref:Uncharacterized protein n=1 Tax=Aldrovandia affinis TaxID=143900 RepID=A0AAD7R281_9TELE|nr:hypothetical protein AAFF_G00055480 [Aldrovandia affinis]